MQSFVRDNQLPEVLKEVFARQPMLNLFLLIDGTANSPLLERFFRYAPDADYHPLFLGTDMEDCLPYSPYLAQISLRHLEFVQTCSAECTPIWFTSPIPMEQQLDFWKSRLYAGLPDGRELLFRYWCPRILEPFIQNAAPSLAREYLNPVVHLITPLPLRRQFTHRHIQSISETKAIPGSWQFSEEALSVFQNSFAILQQREVENYLWCNAPDIMERTHPLLIPQKISAGLNEGYKLGLTQDVTLCRFVECQMRWGDGFWQHERFQGVWQQPNPGETFLDKLNMFSEKEAESAMQSAS